MTVAKLIIKDEVNAKLDGIELTERKKLVEKFKYEIPGAKYQPSVRLGRWDGKVPFFNLGGSTYINLLPQIIPMLDQWGYDIEVEDVREYCTTFKFDQVHESSFFHVKWPKGHTKEGEPISLRDYQVEIINRFLENPQCIQEVATGAGKTLITAALSASVQSYGRSIVIVPSKDLVRQTEADYINMGLDVGVLFGDRKEYTKTHTICTWQSLNALLKNTKNYEADVTIQDFIEGVVCVMVDECFDGNARVLTPSGYMPIKDLKENDQVINYSEKTKEFKVDKIVKQHKNLTTSVTENMYKLEFDNGSVIEVTGNHKFLTNKGWVRADELTADHEIINKT